MMRLVESFKQGQEKLGSMNAELKERVESTLRQWPETINRKFADVKHISKFWTHWNDDSANDEQIEQPQCEILIGLYQRLQQELGEENFVGDWFTVNQDCINQFASVTGDEQWIHIDPIRAQQESPYKSTIAHGFLTLSLIPVLTKSIDSENQLYPEARMVVNIGMNKVRFPFPLREGKRIRARTRIIKITPMKNCLELVREVTIDIENCRRPACVAEVVLRLYS